MCACCALIAGLCLLLGKPEFLFTLIPIVLCAMPAVLYPVYVMAGITRSPGACLVSETRLRDPHPGFLSRILFTVDATVCGERIEAETGAIGSPGLFRLIRPPFSELNGKKARVSYNEKTGGWSCCRCWTDRGF